MATTEFYPLHDGMSSVPAPAVQSHWEPIYWFSHHPVKLTEVVDGERLVKLIAYLDETGDSGRASSDPSSTHKRSMTSRPGDDLRQRMYPSLGFDKLPNGHWTREREYVMSKTQGDHRFQSAIKQVSASVRDFLTPMSGHFDIENCNFCLFAGFLEQIITSMACGRVARLIAFQ